MKPPPADLPDLSGHTVKQLAALARERPEWLDWIRDELKQRENDVDRTRGTP